MRKLSLPNFAVIASHALVVWVLCGVLMFAGMSLFSMGYALVIHAIGAPIIAGLVAWFYFKRFHYASPLVTAFLFVGIVIFMDVFIVALFIEQSFAMFASFIGTWLPLALIFMTTYLTGHFVVARSEAAEAV